MSIYLPGNHCSLTDLEPFYTVDIIITDIDGTVVSGKKPVIQQIKKTIKRLQNQGIGISIATGRTLIGVKQIVQDLGIQFGMPIALYNGGVILENNTENILYTNTFWGKEIIPIIDRLNGSCGCINMYSCDINHDPFRNSENDRIIEEVFTTGINKGRFDINGMKIQELNVNKIEKKRFVSALVEKKGIKKDIVFAIEDYIRNSEVLDYTDSGSGYIEIRGRNSNKGLLINKIKEQKRFPSNRVLAIGDNDNDLELFANADISVAVGNSSFNAVEAADYICNGNNAEGFLDMLYTIQNARRYLGG